MYHQSQRGSQQQPIVIVNTPRASDHLARKAQFSNIAAGKSVADVVRTCLGPRAMLKMLMDPMGGIVLTSDGNAILREIDVAHPGAKAVIELSRGQDEEVGDGTTSVVILAGEILAQAAPLLSHVHPLAVVGGYRRALEDAVAKLEEIATPVSLDSPEELKKLIGQSLGTKVNASYASLLCTLAYQAVKIVCEPCNPSPNPNPSSVMNVVDFKRYARIEKIPGGEIGESCIYQGVIINKDITHPGMRRKIHNPRILLLDCPLEYKKGESQTAIEVSHTQDWSRALEVEEAQIKEMCDKIIALKPDIVVTEKGMSDLAQHYFQQAGVTGLRRARKTDNQRISRATGAKIVNRVEDAKESDLGRGCGLFEVIKIGDEYFSCFVECSSPKACTIVLRGPSKDVLGEVERNLHDALCVARNLMLCPKIVPGGGASEMAVAQHLLERSGTIEGVEQLAYKAVALALDVIPRTLVQNCGGDSVRVLTELKAAISAGGLFGVDGITGKVGGSSELGIWEPLAVKSQTLKSAIEAGCLLLRVDEILSSKKINK